MYKNDCLKCSHSLRMWISDIHIIGILGELSMNTSPCAHTHVCLYKRDLHYCLMCYGIFSFFQLTKQYFRHRWRLQQMTEVALRVFEYC